VEKHVLNLNIHRAGRDYLPPATKMIITLPHHYPTLLKKRHLPLANYFMQMEIDFLCLSCFQVSQLTQ